MKKLVILVFLYTLPLFVNAQTTANEKSTESLLLQLNTAGTDSARAMLSFELAELYLGKDSLKTDRYLKNGLQFSKNTGIPAAVYFYYAGRVIEGADLDQAMALYLKTDTLLQPYKTPQALSFRAKAWYLYGAGEQKKDNPKGFADILLNKAIPLAQQAGDNTMAGKNLLAVAMVFKNAGEFDKADTYIKSAFNTLKLPGVPTHELITAYTTVAENYSLSGKAAEARQALDSAAKLLPAYPDSEFYLDYYAAEGMNYTVMGKFEDALASLEKGISMAAKMGKAYDMQRMQLQQFYAYYNARQFTKAKNVLLLLSEKPEMMMLATNRLQVFYGLALTYEELKDFGPGYTWMKKYAELNDSLSKSQLTNDVHALEIRYRNAEKQKEIEALKAKNIQESLSASNSRLVSGLFGSISMFLVLLLTAGYIIFRNRRKLHEQKELSYRQHLHEIAQEQQLRFSQAIMQGEEQERRRLARDLHDGLGGMIAGARINLSAHMKSGEIPTAAPLEKITQQLDKSVTELRRIAHNMMPATLLEQSLEAAINDLCESMMNDHTRITFQAIHLSDHTLAEDVQLHIYRIIQELLNNAVRHGKAKNIMLQVSIDEGKCYITAEDDGKGFDITNSSKGIGLNNIRNRVGFMKGNIDIDSRINQGTTVNIELNVQ
ncbi:Histidine kinase-, DNA gyrase B-, and HSP90-like ATPase [Chitinophaga jiangningensis]|uniref:histidine kinase n=1 Tax=Chitinophaga jiangningensis TaxID=1419482 RepID=A0A1M6YU10_9BACT|nr:sensor histidine kinase [Chitinophaga jiangningensis]SHL21801.1 Histidine kinase-, DNA gyrase B-, and HSP90-like ATPase [Chitinophaga jiangningensis]